MKKLILILTLLGGFLTCSAQLKYYSVLDTIPAKFIICDSSKLHSEDCKLLELQHIDGYVIIKRRYESETGLVHTVGFCELYADKSPIRKNKVILYTYYDRKEQNGFK